MCLHLIFYHNHRFIGPRIIVFVLGGITFSEIRVAYELMIQTKREIILGSTSLLTPPNFIASLSSLVWAIYHPLCCATTEMCTFRMPSEHNHQRGVAASWSTHPSGWNRLYLWILCFVCRVKRWAVTERKKKSFPEFFTSHLEVHVNQWKHKALKVLN